MTWQIDFTNVCYNVGLVVKKKKKKLKIIDFRAVRNHKEKLVQLPHLTGEVVRK